jgi:hypothetical protein
MLAGFEGYCMKPNLPLRRWLARLRHTRSNRVRVLTISGAFAALIGAGFLAAKDPVGLFQSKSVSAGTGVQTIKAVGLTGASALGGDDPVLRFTDTKMGQVVFAARSDTCRRVLFDNRTGARLEAGEVFCGQSQAQVVDAETSNRLQFLSKSFHR